MSRLRARDMERARLDLSGAGLERPPTPAVRARRRRRPGADRLSLAIVVLALVAGGAFAWRARSTTAGAGASPAVATATGGPSVEIEPLADPTPIFARYRSMQIYLPVHAKDVTVLAFHQAARDNALHLASLVPDASMSRASRLKKKAHYTYSAGQGDDAADGAEVTAAEQGVPTILRGEALRLWRSSRHGAADSAADVGAKPGTAVFAPVSGRVLLVRPYKLYNEFPDYEVHIQPDGWPEVDCVLIHVDNVSVMASQTVIGGVTPIARVRDLARKVGPQLAQYVPDAGDHVHVQLNRLEVPGKIDLVGGS